MAKRSRPKTRSANEDYQNVIKMWVAPRSLMTKSVLCKRSNICRYREAGIVTIPDRNIAKKIIVLYDLYLAIKKKKSLTTKGATDQRASFKASLMSLLLMLKIRLLTFTTKKRRRSFLPSRPKDQQEVRYELQ